MNNTLLNSCLYECEVIHSRKHPIKHAFKYRYVTFCLDLDEISTIKKRFFLFGLSWLHPFRFREKDFIFGKSAKSPKELKDAVIAYAKQKGELGVIHRVELIAHMRTFGYCFNPAAFYYCYSADHQLLCAIVEVTNTYWEKKTYFIHSNSMIDQELKSSEPKYFYISPFVNLEAEFEFKIRKPQHKYLQYSEGQQYPQYKDQLFIQIHSKNAVHASVSGKSLKLTYFNLIKNLCRYPFLTLGIMLKIHYQAALLYLKGVPTFKKSERPEFQKKGLL